MTTQSGVPPVALDAAERIGPYRILQVLGEGGMGIVYDAEETGPVRRRVALKVLKDQHAPRELVARFEVEQQALAVMSHPGIAKVLSAGTTSSGQPYFAMELVRGLPITQFCDDQRLSVRGRLELFIAVCQAVQHAHQKGVIHRDLKPSNILITEADGRPEPRIIDFGIAKAIGQQLTDKTLVTAFGHAMGTAAYMSPEQAESGNRDVDTRADVYSLGVVLYQILVGRLPLDPSEIGLHVFLARLLARDCAPPTPSARLTDGGCDRRTIARARNTDPDRLLRTLRGDLDWIVLKAMEPDRNRRYQTVNGLVMDIQRHLADEPIIARPPSAAYRFGKFVRRHRGASMIAVIALLLIVTSSIFTSIGMVRATRAELRAEEEAATARAATAFLEETFGADLMGDLFRPLPGAATDGRLPARELLDRGVARASGLADRPALRSRVLHTMGVSYYSLGLFDDARRVLGDALSAREALYGARDTLVAETLDQLGVVAVGKGDYDEADRLLQRSLDIRMRAQGAGHVAVATSWANLGLLRMRQGRHAEADSLYRLAIASHERRVVPNPRRFARDLMGLANVRISQQRMAEAEPLIRRASEIQERALGAEHIEVAATLNNLGIVYWYLGRYADALPLYERARRVFERSLPPDHPAVASSLNNVAETYWKLGRVAEAEPMFRRALDIKERTLSPSNPSIATTLNGLAGILVDQQRYAEAESLYRRALRIRREVLGSNHPGTRETVADLAKLLRATGRNADAAQLTAAASVPSAAP